MARVFPSDLSKLALAGAHRAELTTLALLRKRLPDDYTVFHGVHWSREYAKWTHFGVAREAHDRTVENGRRPLLLCFNRSLAERLRARVRAGGYVDTWNGFCAKFLESQGARLDFSASHTNPRFWQEVQEQVMGATIPDDWLFDTLIVDEGQDFEQEWYDILMLFVTPNAEVLWLEDADQNIYGKEPVTLPGFAGYRADTNFRSPERIATFIRDVLAFARTMHVPACCGNSSGYQIAKPWDLQVRVVRVMLSNSGIGSTETAAAFPLRLIESGPVAGAIVGRQIAQVLALPEVLPAGGQLLHRSALGILPRCRRALPSP